MSRTRLFRRCTALLLAMCLTVLPSCTAIQNIAEAYKDFGRINEIGADYHYNKDINETDFDESLFGIVEERFALLDEIAADANPMRFYAFVQLYGQLWKDLCYIADTAMMRFVRYSLDTGDKEVSDAYKALNEKYLDLYYRFLQYYPVLYHSALSDYFYAGWEKEEIDRALKIAAMASGEVLDLQKQIDALTIEYKSLDQSSDSFLTSSAALYARIVSLKMQIAEKLGFDSYADYAYEYLYARDFTPEDAEKCCAFAKDHIVPLADRIATKLRASEGIGELASRCEALDSDPLSIAEAKEILSDYYAHLGEESEKAVRDWEERSYLSDSDSSLSSAYTVFLNYFGYPVCYFGKGVNTLMTYIHEQGHYNAFVRSDQSASSLDLCELQSQGNKWLYLAYRAENANDKDADLEAEYFLCDDLITILLSVCCDAFERYVYTHPGILPAEYDGIFVSLAKEIGAYDFLAANITVPPEAYWHYAIVDNSFYYLSYAVSGIPAIDLYITAKTEGFDRAAQAYLSCCKTPQDAGFESTLNSAGLASPFEEAVYRKAEEFFR